jgi:hypothetical protein
MRGTLRASLATGFCLLVAPSAGATPPGLHVDPDSPGGKEYAIPLDQARDAAGGGSSYGGGSGSHLFGVGVSGANGGGGSGSSGASGTDGSGGAGTGGSDGSGSGSGGSDGSDGSGSASHKDSGDSGSSAGTRARLSTLNVAAANPEGGAQAPLLVLGASAAIVLLGVLLGLMLRRRRMSGASS